MLRSGSFISAIAASTVALSVRPVLVRAPSAFSSRARAFIAACSSAVNPVGLLGAVVLAAFVVRVLRRGFPLRHRTRLSPVPGCGSGCRRDRGTAQSRTPYGWSVGSWTTSASPACSRSNVPSRSSVARRMLAKVPLAIISAIVRRSSSVMPGVAAGRIQDDRRVGLVGGADRDPVHPAVFDVVADLEAEGVAIEGQGGLRVVVRKEACVNGDVHDGHARCGSAAGASRFLTGLVTCFATHGGIPAVAPAASRR